MGGGGVAPQQENKSKAVDRWVLELNGSGKLQHMVRKLMNDTKG